MTVDFTKLNTISEIQAAKEGTNEIFTQAEKLIFASDSQIGGDVEKARQVATLWVKLKKAKKTFKEDTALHDEIKEEQKNDSLAYRVLESYDEKVSDAISHLAVYYKDKDSKDKTEPEMKEQITA